MSVCSCILSEAEQPCSCFHIVATGLCPPGWRLLCSKTVSEQMFIPCRYMATHYALGRDFIVFTLNRTSWSSSGSLEAPTHAVKVCCLPSRSAAHICQKHFSLSKFTTKICPHWVADACHPPPLLFISSSICQYIFKILLKAKVYAGCNVERCVTDTLFFLTMIYPLLVDN